MFVHAVYFWLKPELNQADGYHPNGKGVDVMVEGMYPLVDAALRYKISVLQQDQWQRQVNGMNGGDEPKIVFPTGDAPLPQ